ncbi:hypothetical protein [Coraliomargarita parva]|uniref:hypothetical protein n=1 Tax=Coraliomargarita parva TaxID=3014050 RepID=UPI0022B3E9E2|nr:hypothetical protein [Coraliomargarita parva]
MKPVLILALLTFCIHSNAATTIWSKEFPAAQHGDDPDDYAVMVGQDGSVGIMDAYGNGRKVNWYDRSGTLIQEFLTDSALSGFIYISQHELVIQGSETHLYQLDDTGELGHTVTNSRVSVFLTSFSGFNYPYLLEKKLGPDNQYQLTLYDLTNENYLNIVGDAVIGVHGKNLKVQWKTLSNASYKVQTSTDLTEWTDYTGTINGTGGTQVIMIPFSESSDQTYARVVKL